MRRVRPRPEHLALAPFWRTLSAKGPRVIAFDVPITKRSEPFHGLEINGWASNDLLAAPGAYSAGLFERLQRRFERPVQHQENYGLAPFDDLLAFDDQVHTARAVARLGAAPLREEPGIWR